MYQAIYYDHYNRTAHLRDDELGWQVFQYQPTYYKADPTGEYITLDGRRVRKTKSLNMDDPDTYEKDVDKSLSVLLDVYNEDSEAPKWHNKVFIDIETQMGGTINLEYCQKAPVKVTAVALYDDNTKDYFVYILDEARKLSSHTKGDVTVIPCSTEQSLLSSFLDKWLEIDPTIVSTWNGDNFDIPYLYNRIKKILGSEKANSLSPINIVKFDDYDERMPYKIAGVNSLDMMRLYKKFIPKQQPSYSLDYISTKELGKGKIKYEGSLEHLFKTDIDKFIEYNVNDVRLLVELDQKKKFIDLAVMLAHTGHVPYHYVYQSSRLIEGAIMTYLRKKNIVSPNKPTTNNPELKKLMEQESEDDDKFAGAYVKEVIPGLYGWNIDEDLTSLYPSCAISLNTGIETLLFKIVIDDPFDDSWNFRDLKLKDPNTPIQIETLEGRYKNTTIGKIIKYIEETNSTISPNGVVFDSSQPSVMVEIMIDWFKKRKQFKDIMKKCAEDGDKAGVIFYDLMQSIQKIFLNSIYGVMGLKTFRYSDGKDFIASAITAMGRLTIMSSADFVNEDIHKYCGKTGKDIVDNIIISDTDSLYINVEEVLRYHDLYGKQDDDIVLFLRDYSKEMSLKLNTFYINFTKECFNSKINRLEMKSETIGKRIYISAKKQYAQLIVEKEGIKKEGDEQFDMKGLDFLKASFPKIFRDFTQGLIKDILFGSAKSSIDKKILDFREMFKTLSLEEAAKPTGINKYKEYYGGRRAGAIFSNVLPHCPINTKAAIYYNDLLKFKELDKKHSTIQVGDKMKWVYLTPNCYGIEVLGMHEVDPPDEIVNFLRQHIDRAAMFDKNLVKKLNKIYENLGWGTVSFNKNVNKFFKSLQ